MGRNIDFRFHPQEPNARSGPEHRHLDDGNPSEGQSGKSLPPNDRSGIARALGPPPTAAPRPQIPSPRKPLHKFVKLQEGETGLRALPL